MKKIILFLFFSGVVSAQTNEKIDFKYRLNDPKSTTKSLEVIDTRKDKNIGQFSRKERVYTFSFPTDDPENDITNWFERDNKKRGTRELVIVLNKLKVYEKKGIDRVDYAKVFISASSYEKIGTDYFLLNLIDGTKTINTWEYQNISKTITSVIGMSLNKFIKESYSSEPLKISVPEEKLIDYEKYLSENLPIFNTNQLRDGVYKDYLSFFNQKPLKDYKLIKDEDGNFAYAEGQNNKLRADQIFIYVENGFAYKSTLGGFLKVEKDEKGFYIFSGITLLNQGLPKYDFTPPGGGAIAAGIGAIGNSIQRKEQKKMLENEVKEKVYISPLTGEYLFEY